MLKRNLRGREHGNFFFFFLIHTSWASNGARESFVNMEFEKTIGFWVDKHASHLGKYVTIGTTRV